MALIHCQTLEGDGFARKVASPDGRYFALWTGDGICCGKYYRGRLWLFGPGGELFSPAKTLRPREIAVADSGRLIVGDWLSRDTLSCWIRIFAPDGRELFSRRHRFNVVRVSIHADGRIAVYDTAGPEYKTRVVDVDAGTIARKLPLTDHAELLSREIPLQPFTTRPILQTPDSDPAK